MAYGCVEGDAALVLVDAVGGLRDADLVEVGAEEIHGRGGPGRRRRRGASRVLGEDGEERRLEQKMVWRGSS